MAGLWGGPAPEGQGQRSESLGSLAEAVAPEVSGSGGRRPQAPQHEAVAVYSLLGPGPL